MSGDGRRVFLKNGGRDNGGMWVVEEGYFHPC